MNPLGKAVDLRYRGDLALRPPDLALRSTLRQHPRGPPAAPVHGRRLAVLLGLAAIGALTFPMAFFFFVFEVDLIATLQAFIFSILTAIYIGGATAETH